MPFLLILGIWCLSELIIFFLALTTFGFLPTLGAVILSTTIGLLLIRQQRANMTMMIHKPVEKYDARDGVYHFTAGMLLMIPGFLSSVIGLIFLISPLRRLIGFTMLKLFRPNVVANAFFNFGESDPSAMQRDFAEKSRPEVSAKREDGTPVQAELVDEPKKNSSHEK